MGGAVWTAGRKRSRMLCLLSKENPHGQNGGNGDLRKGRGNGVLLRGCPAVTRRPAISKSIAQLEERLGAKLLLRSTRGLTPTEAGESFYERAKRAIEEADEAEHAARGAGTSLSGRLRVSAAPTFASLHVIPHLPEFLARHPNLDMEIVLDDEQIDLIGEGIDISLRMGNLPESSLTVRKIGQSPRIVVAAPSYLQKKGEPKIPGELIGHESVIYAKGPGRDVWLFSKKSSEISVTVQGRVRVSAAEGVCSAVLAGMGLTVASEWMFTPELAVGSGSDGLDDRSGRSVGCLSRRSRCQCQSAPEAGSST
jgi:DNA-binding transcriptional LysR family regulator